MAKATVLTIHGLASNGAWQQRARKVFEPHFHYHAIRYRDYHLGGVVCVFIWPWAIPLLVMLASLAADGPVAEGIRWGAAPACLVAIAWFEFGWSGRSAWLLVPLALIAAVVAAITGVDAGPIRDALLYGALAAGIVFQEFREQNDGPEQKQWIVPGLYAAGSAVLLWIVFAWPEWGFWLVAPALLLYSLIEPLFRRRRTLTKVLGRFQRHWPSQGRPHVIAHSLGTFLTGQVVCTTDLAFETVILVGCVLQEDFPWHRYVGGATSTVGEVRNETGSRDWVVWMAGLARWIAQPIGMGDAGRTGFHDPRVEIHSLSDVFQSCRCCRAGVTAPIHNAMLRDMAHSSMFNTPKHAQLVWLPALWEYRADEYLDFIRLCREAHLLRSLGVIMAQPKVLAEFAEVKDYFDEVDDLCRGIEDPQARSERELIMKAKRLMEEHSRRIGELLRRAWHWRTGPEKNLERYVTDIVSDLLADSSPTEAELSKVTRRILAKTIAELCQLVADAMEELDREDQARADRIRLLDPALALRQAVVTALEVKATNP